MYNPFFPHPEVWQRLHVGPLSLHLDAFAQWLLEQGYAGATARDKLRVVAKLSQWLEHRQLGVEALDEACLAAFLHEFHQRERRTYHGDITTLETLLGQLRSRGIVPVLPVIPDNSALARLEQDFAEHLGQEGGLAAATVHTYAAVVRRFLTARFGNRPLELARLSAHDVTAFVLAQARHFRPRTAQLMTTALRRFFRFLQQRGEVQLDLMAAVPSVADWRLAAVPKYLESDQVEQLLQSCDRKTAVGRRDYAVLLLLARLGLRAGELVQLCLEDIDWQAGLLTVRGKGRRTAQLPLPVDVGEALAAYLREARPTCTTRCVFVHSRAPYRGFAGASGVDCLVRRALRRAGLSPAFKGSHLLRHSLATQMLRNGASMAEIGQLLRHCQAQTTEIYAKVDATALGALAQPWPGGTL